jgi:tetratricopeptide (TPR) repeat protein
MRARADAQKAISIQPDSSLALVVRARLQRSGGDLDGALSDLTTAVNGGDRDANLYVERGDVYRSLGAYGEAISDYASALDIRPHLTTAVTGRALSHQYLGSLEEAQADFDRALAIEPAVASHYHLRGRLRRWRGDIHGALVDHNRAIELDPNAQDAYAGRAFTAIALGDFPRALDDINKVIELGPAKSFAYYLWQWEMYVRLGRLTEAQGAIEAGFQAASDELERTVVRMTSGAESLESALSKCHTGCDRAGTAYYAGVRALLDAQQDDAEARFRECISAGCVREAEYDLARLRLPN